MWPQPKRSSRKRSGTKGRLPHTITLDGYAASIEHCLLRLPIASPYLDNLIEQDHCGIESRTRPMPAANPPPRLPLQRVPQRIRGQVPPARRTQADRRPRPRRVRGKEIPIGWIPPSTMPSTGTALTSPMTSCQRSKP
jgi:hypothetical protein